MLIKNIINTQKCNNKTALVCKGFKISYRELHKAANSISERIKSIQTNCCIGIFVPNSIEYVVAYFGISMAGKVIVPFAKDIKKEQFIHEVIYTELDMIITNTTNEKIIINYLNNVDFKMKILNFDNYTVNYLNDNCKLQKNTNKIGGLTEDDVALLLHTSGTMTLPKKVMLTHKNLIGNVESILKVAGLDKNEKTLIVLPLCLSTANIQMLQHIYIGAEIHIMNSFFLPASVMDYIFKNQITNVSIVPFMAKAFSNLNINKRKNNPLKNVFVGGGPMDKKAAKEFRDKFPDVNLVTMYGQTEASPRITMLTGEYSINKIGTPGKPLPGLKIRILKEGSEECKTGEPGEITVEGPNVMKGYYKNPEASENTLKNGVLYTGDIGRLDEDGFLHIVGRKKNMILINGKNIYPEQIEEVLCLYDGVSEVYVYGVKDETYSEQVVADIVINKKDFSISQLINFCKDKLSSSQIPKSIRIVQEVKKTNSYKKARNQEVNNESREYKQN